MTNRIGEKISYTCTKANYTLTGMITSKVKKGVHVVDDIIRVHDYVDAGDINSYYIVEEDRVCPDEFEAYKEVIEHGASKYGYNNWLEPDGQKSSLRDMHASMFRHLAESSSGIRVDHESGLDPLLHLITRAQMVYTRLQRNINHKED